MSNRYILLLPPTNEVWGKAIFSEACVKNSVHTGRGSTCAGTPPGTRYTPPGTRYTPRPGTTPRTRYTPQDQVHPPGPGTPPGTRYTPLPDQVHPPPGSSACREIRATSGRYASYWNAFLLKIEFSGKKQKKNRFTQTIFSC